MADERYTFEQARIRLEEIAAEVRKKDTSLEKSLDLLEEGVRLANICTELVDHTDLGASAVVEVPEGTASTPEGEDAEEALSGQAAGDGDADVPVEDGTDASAPDAIHETDDAPEELEEPASDGPDD